MNGPLHGTAELPVVKFKRIPITLPEFRNDFKSSDLSTDQQYLFDICKPISDGEVSPNLSKRSAGKLNHARWLTLANNILRLYVSTAKPTADLNLIVNFIMIVYAKSWFRIKLNPKCVDGPKNLFETIKSSRHLPQKYRNIVNESIQTNGFFAHSENILLAMIHDDSEKVREVAYQRIVQARTNASSVSSGAVRRFEVPQIDFKARTYYNLIDWNSTTLTEPPLT